MAKRSLCMLLALATLFSLAAPAFAEEAPAEEPVVTEEPVAETTEEPVEEAAPVEEPIPVGATEEPVEVTEEPVVTEGPVMTEEPVVTEEPEATEAPEIVDAEDEPDPADVFAGAVGVCGAEGNGANLTWTLSSDGVLTISGTGKMGDYSYEHKAPWHDHCNEINRVVISNGVTSIGDEAFYFCTSLTSAVIPASVTSIGEFAFDSCRSLQNITIPNGVVSIGVGAFESCNSLTSVTIPASVTSIDGGVVFTANNLKNIYVAEGNKNFASVDGVLFNADKTELICYPCGKTASSYVIPGTVKTIGDKAFYGNDNLTSITIPASVTNIEYGMFGAFPGNNMTDISVAQGNKSYASIDGVLFSADKKTLVRYPRGKTAASYTIPDSVISIAEHAFWFSDLTSVIIPNSVISIGESAFEFSDLMSVSLSDCLTTIGTQAFAECSSLTSVTIPVTVTSIGFQAFCGCGKLTSMTVLSPYCDIYSYMDTLGKPGTVVISGYDGSTAQSYANNYGHIFQSLGPSPVTPTPKPTATPTPAPDKLATPKITKMENTASGLKVTWGKVDGAVRYTVFYKLKGASKWTKIGTTTATSYTRKAKDLKSGKTYVFTIRCVKNDKKTYTSDYDKAGKSLTYYAAPTVKIAKASNGGIKVTWNKVAGASRYMVYYKENGGSWKRIGTTTATSYTRAASKLKNGVTYQFTVRCVKNDKKTMLSYYKASNSLKYKK